MHRQFLWEDSLVLCICLLCLPSPISVVSLYSLTLQTYQEETILNTELGNRWTGSLKASAGNTSYSNTSETDMTSLLEAVTTQSVAQFYANKSLTVSTRHRFRLCWDQQSE